MTVTQNEAIAALDLSPDWEILVNCHNEFEVANSEGYSLIVREIDGTLMRIRNPVYVDPIGGQHGIEKVELDGWGEAKDWLNDQMDERRP